MSTETMESAIAEEARAIITLCGLQDRDFTDILDGIAHKARNILQTLNEGDPEPGEGETCEHAAQAKGS